MSGNKSNYLDAKLLDYVLSLVAYSPPATVYVALFTARGTDAQSNANTNWTEVSGGSYARQAVTNNATNFPAASGVSPVPKSNGTAITFTTATGTWGTVVAVGIYDASSGGNLLYWADLTTVKAIGNGDTATFPIGSIVITEK